MLYREMEEMETDVRYARCLSKHYLQLVMSKYGLYVVNYKNYCQGDSGKGP